MTQQQQKTTKMDALSDAPHGMHRYTPGDEDKQKRDSDSTSDDDGGGGGDLNVVEISDNKGKDDDHKVAEMNDVHIFTTTEHTRHIAEPAAPFPAAQVSVVAEKKNKKSSLVPKSSSKQLKKTASMMQTWNKKQKELHNDQETHNDEKLKADQLPMGLDDALTNPNLIPVIGNWRDRAVENSKEENEKIYDSLGNQKQMASVDLNALSSGLPDGWLAMWNESTQCVYYANMIEKISQWERPC